MPARVEQRALMDQDFNMTVGTNLRIIRSNKGVTAANLAERVDMDPSHISRVENGARGLSFREALRICEVLGIGHRELTRQLPNQAHCRVKISLPT